MKKFLSVTDIMADNSLTRKWVDGKLDRQAVFEQGRTVCSQVEATLLVGKLSMVFRSTNSKLFVCNVDASHDRFSHHHNIAVIDYARVQPLFYVFITSPTTPHLMARVICIC